MALELTVDTPISTLSFVTVTYTSDAAPDLPTNLVIKSPNVPLTTQRDSTGEAVFYRRLAPLLGSPPAVRCVAAIEEGNDAAETVYRGCVVRNLTIPILFWSRGMKPEAWFNRLQCALAAYADLGCDELLRP